MTLHSRIQHFIESDEGVGGRAGRRLRQLRLDTVPLAGRPVLFERLPKHSVGAEIGVHRGDLSAVLLEEIRPTRLHLIDPWEYTPEAGRGTALYGKQFGISQRNMDRRFEAVLARFRAEISDGTAQIHRKRSQDAAAEFADHSLDWVYVDGDHSFEGVLRDLRCFIAKVRPGGLIAGDDYGPAEAWWGDGVERAVTEFLTEAAVSPLVLGERDDQFVLQVNL